MRDKYGRTALMIAAIHNNEDAVRVLLLNGANRKAVDTEQAYGIKIC